MELVEESEDQSKRLIQSNIKYLYDLCNNKDLNVPALKSLFWTKCKLMELRTKIQLPSEQYKLSNRCSRCFLDRAGNSNFEVKPMQLQRFERKLASKVEKAKKRNKPVILTKFQQKCLNKLKKKYPDGLTCQQNQLVINCKVCSQKSSIRMLKPKKAVVKTAIKKIKKAKMKKDKNCGLKAEAVLEASLNKSKSNKKKNKTMDQTNKSNIIRRQSQPKQNKKAPLRNQNSKENSPVTPTSRKKKFRKTVPPTNENQKSFATSNFIPLKSSKKTFAVTPSPKSKVLKKDKFQFQPQTNENDRLFATSDFIPLNVQGSKFKLNKKEKVELKGVSSNIINKVKMKKQSKKKEPKVLSEKAKLELFLKNL